MRLALMHHVKLTVKWTVSNADSADESCRRAGRAFWVCWVLAAGVGTKRAAVGLFAASKFDVTDLALADLLTDRTDRQTEVAGRRWKSVQNFNG